MLPLEIINLELDVAIAALDLMGPEMEPIALLVSIVEMAIDSIYGGKCCFSIHMLCINLKHVKAIYVNAGRMEVVTLIINNQVEIYTLMSNIDRIKFVHCLLKF